LIGSWHNQFTKDLILTFSTLYTHKANEFPNEEHSSQYHTTNYARKRTLGFSVISYNKGQKTKI